MIIMSIVSLQFGFFDLEINFMIIIYDSICIQDLFWLNREKKNLNLKRSGGWWWRYWINKIFVLFILHNCYGNEEVIGQTKKQEVHFFGREKAYKSFNLCSRKRGMEWERKGIFSSFLKFLLGNIYGVDIWIFEFRAGKIGRDAHKYFSSSKLPYASKHSEVCSTNLVKILVEALLVCE